MSPILSVCICVLQHIRAINKDDDLGNITPTVELNALAMKRGETTNYHVEPPQAVQNMNAAPPPPQRQIPGAGSGNYPWYYGQGGGVGGGGRGGMGRGRGFHKDHVKVYFSYFIFSKQIRFFFSTETAYKL